MRPFLLFMIKIIFGFVFAKLKSMLKKLLLTFCILIQLNLFAQQCGYDNYYLFVVNVHTKNSSDKIPNLKMYLVDENEKPCTAQVIYKETGSKKVNEEQSQWKHRYDTLFFWDNKNAKERAGDRPLLRQKFYNIGDNYIVAFRLDVKQLKDPQHYPIYQLKIESGLNEETGNLYPTQMFQLPINKAVRICNNNVTENFKPYKPVETIDGKAFKPIDIILNEEIQQAVDVANEEKSKLQYTVRFEFLENKNQPIELTEYNIVTAKVYNTQTGKLHQEIYIPSKEKSVNKESKSIVQFIDFYNRGIEEAKDFCVLMESWRDVAFKVVRNKRHYYIFNPTKKQYELDEELSRDDVFYYEPLKKMRRYVYEKTEKSNIVYTYQLENKKWALIDKNETLFKPNPPTIKYAPKACIFVENKWHSFPVQAVADTNATKQIKDTFWLYNACDDTVCITKVQSPNRDFFSINQTLLPKQKTPLIFNGIIQNSSFDFITKNFSCYLTLTDNHTLAFEVSVPTVSNNATVVYCKDSSVNYAIAEHNNKKFSNAILTYPDGKLRAKGFVQDGDTSLKVGKWEYYKKDTWGIDEVIYSKAISLSALSTVNASQYTNFNIKVLENGKWKQPVIDNDNNQKNFYITKEADSVVAYTDTTNYAFGLTYDKLPANFSMQFFLLKPNERTMKIGYYRMPFSVLKNQYTIIPDYSKFKSKNRTTYQITDSILQVLEKKYPKIVTVYVSRHQRGIDLSKLSFEDQYKVVMQLTNDTCIRTVCNLFTMMNKNRMAYCNSEVYVELNTTDIENFKKEALKLGFANIRTDMGSNRYWLTHASAKLIDEGFFEAFDRLTRNPMVISAHFNTYFEAELDNEIKPF